MKRKIIKSFNDTHADITSIAPHKGGSKNIISVTKGDEVL